MRLSGKRALITGAARGIGRATAVAFAEQGADLVLLDISADVPGCPYPLGTVSQLKATAEECRAAGASVVEHVGDVRDGDDLRSAAERALDRFGGIDVLVNNAGIAAPSGRPAHEITEDEWSLMLDIDLSGSWRAMRAVLPTMVAQRSGSVINVSSTAGMVGYRYFAGYVAAKHGLVGLTRATALDYAPHGIRVNALCPGSVRDEPALEGRMLVEIARCLDVPTADHEQTFVESQPMNRLVEASDVASTAVWLASDESRQVTGAVVPVDGGFTVR
ncbi:oxidoreductase [Streptomyces populi]|uniref:Oxidoreductase n=1 Tax=Streptomyces populi TaxID=2058924 RepID=A0A2I0SJZ0_9ACTN|nr:mycofactocin-coupled SDR family oxidoreductase [Streptomyces populi]PKT70246.1 oxidoreductase [Streptomyces populi]